MSTTTGVKSLTSSMLSSVQEIQSNVVSARSEVEVMDPGVEDGGAAKAPGDSNVKSLESGKPKGRGRSVRSWKRVSAALQVALALSISVVVIVSVIVPVILATQSGRDSVYSVLVPLTDSICANAYEKTINYLGSASSISTISSDWATRNGTNPSVPSFLEMHHFFWDLTKRLDPSHNVRYVYWASMKGDMTCISYDNVAGKTFRQEVVIYPNGTLSNQFEWILDSNGENTSYPFHYTDMGYYDVFTWLPKYLGNASWWEQPHQEATSYNTSQTIISFFAPVFIRGVYMGSFGTDFLIDNLSYFFAHGLNISSDTVVFLCNSSGYIIASSVACAGRAANSSLISVYDCQDTIVAQVGTELLHLQRPLIFNSTSQLQLNLRVDGHSVLTFVSVYPLLTSFFPSWSLVVAVPSYDFTLHLNENNKRTILSALAVLFVAICTLLGITCAITNRIAVASVQIHDALEHNEGLDLDSGVEKILATLHQVAEQTTDIYSKSRIQAVISQLISGINTGLLFAPNLQAGHLDSATMEWLQVELGQKNTSKQPNLIPTSLSRQSSVSYINSQRTESYVIQQLPQEFADWNFSIFKFVEVSHDVLPVFAIYAVRKFAQELELAEDSLFQFFKNVSRKYQDVPFHSALHAADVVQGLFCLISWFSEQLGLSALDRLALILAGVIHDVDHPGLNNSFQIMSQTELAQIYNDQTPLEHHHAHVGLSLLTASGVLESLDSSATKHLRSVIISLVLGTDMGQHWKIVSEFNTLRQHGQISTKSSAEDKLLVMRLLLKLADISNVTRPVDVMQVWVQKLNEEFYFQGDKERQLGLPVTTFMDREQSSVKTVAQTQVNFLQIVASPMFEAFNSFLPIPMLMQHLTNNSKYWATILALETTKSGQ
ncbi:high affinity cAMP-specific and IBMX-insensitive 3',5'-cyclic phosphodiesterase 8A [Pelomyxa schiedti]|nr:high affinity cAMP-specific and IBMX-insensitive 3',5'-cyclic phosphodiesterase 8A [Pelomyxa schiedti]